MGVATRIIADTGGFAGTAHTFQLAPPLDGFEYVTVFAVDMPGTQHDETTIVPARPDGSAVLMNRLPGSIVGWADHGKALGLAGYSIVEPEPVEPEPVEPEPVEE